MRTYWEVPIRWPCLTYKDHEKWQVDCNGKEIGQKIAWWQDCVLCTAFLSDLILDKSIKVHFGEDLMLEKTPAGAFEWSFKIYWKANNLHSSNGTTCIIEPDAMLIQNKTVDSEEILLVLKNKDSSAEKWKKRKKLCIFTFYLYSVRKRWIAWLWTKWDCRSNERTVNKC